MLDLSGGGGGAQPPSLFWPPKKVKISQKYIADPPLVFPQIEYWSGMLTRSQPNEAEAEATTHEAELGHNPRGRGRGHNPRGRGHNPR